MNRTFRIILENGDLLVVNKPAGLVCHPTKPDGFSSLISQVRRYLGPGVTPHLVNRLDRETSGLVVVAKNLPAIRELRRVWQLRRVSKEYLAVVHGQVRPGVTSLYWPLGPDESSDLAVKDRVRTDGAPALTRLRLERVFQRGGEVYSLLRVWPLTGRKHQIRLHLSHLGHPIVGDKLYGAVDCYLDFAQNRLSPAQISSLKLPFQALHALSLHIFWRGCNWRFTAEPETWLQEFVAG